MSGKVIAVKNRSAATIQITAEQLLREAQERGLEVAIKAPDVHITDKEELLTYQQDKRKDFEDQLRRKALNTSLWTRYALWESSQKEFERARSIFERCLETNYRNETVWIKYAEMEITHKFINHARNIYDRCITYLPMVDVFWYKYTYMEEMIDAIDQARGIFERWMKWEPNDLAWNAYIKFELRHNNISNATLIFERFIQCHPTCNAYIKYTKLLEKQHDYKGARHVYERSFVELHQQEKKEKLLVNFARFEVLCKEYHRARVIYKYAIEVAEKATTSTDDDDNKHIAALKQEYIAFEKKYGDRKGIEDAILLNRRKHYQDLLASDGYNYDAWVDYCKLEEAEGDVTMIREVYEQAIANTPPINQKKYWKRYIYLWIFYALFEELQAKDIHRASMVYKACLDIIPHKIFTFGKIWIYAAHVEIRRKDVSAARKILGAGIGMCAKDNLFKRYIELEQQLGEIDRCRSIYIKYLEYNSSNCYAWQAFAAMEISVGETARARSIYEISINQSVLDMPELLWKAYIDFEISEREYERVSLLYERLLEKTSHVKVWISYAMFNCIECNDIHASRDVFNKAYHQLKQQELKEERVMLLNAWIEAEKDHTDGDVSLPEAKYPRKIKMKRVVKDEETGREVEGVYEDYYDYQFPDDEKKVAGMRILETAMKWKQAAEAAAAAATTTTTTASTVDTPGIVAATTAATISVDDNSSSSSGSSTGGNKRKSEEIDIDDI